ncbi:MAG: recombination protein RecR [Alphaproteobacteria bacterium]|nr:MAG: recombination protein RecR [Alphaproteobacteria bacterium]
MAKEIDQLIQMFAKLPGLGSRSGRRIALHLMKHRETILEPLINRMQTVHDTLRNCKICHNLDSNDCCHICTNLDRDNHIICVVTDVADVWALERAHFFKGRYHVLGGVLSAIDGVTPDNLTLESLKNRLRATPCVTEIVLALPATLDGQITAQYVRRHLEGLNLYVSSLAQGVPMGGELDYLDDGTLHAAYNARQKLPD